MYFIIKLIKMPSTRRNNRENKDEDLSTNIEEEEDECSIGNRMCMTNKDVEEDDEEVDNDSNCGSREISRAPSRSPSFSEDSLSDNVKTQNYFELLFWDMWSIGKIYLLWVFVHFVSANLYAYYCTNLSFYGLLSTPFLVVAPHCTALNWTINWTHGAIKNMWLTLGSWFVAKIVDIK